MISLRDRAFAAVAVLAGVLSLCTGCIIPTPIGILLVPCEGGGQELTFVEHKGTTISQDGLLIVHRDFSEPTPLGGEQRPALNAVVPIRGGKARIPARCKLTSVWLTSNMFSFYLIPQLRLCPLDDLTVIPLVRGYDRPHTSASWRLLAYRNINDHQVRLWKSKGTEEHALAYYRDIRKWLRSEAEGGNNRSDLDIRLQNEDHKVVKSFLDEEIGRCETALKNRRVPLGRESCTGDLTGNVSGVCPECRTPIEKPEPKS